MAALCGIALVASALLPFKAHAHMRAIPALFMVVVIVLVASRWGSKPALFASGIALFALSYFFIPPYRSLWIAKPHHLLFFIAFASTAVIVGQLSARLHQRAEEAERAKAEVQRLYAELQSAFEHASDAKALRQSEQFKSALLDCMAHDLRTPLNSIKLAIATLLADRRLQNTLDSGQRELLAVLDYEANRLRKLISNIDGLGHLSTDEFMVRRQPAALDEIVRQALELLNQAGASEQMQITIADALYKVNADSRAVAQVLFMLVENACKYADPASPISISVTGSGDEVTFSVEDQGPGIPPELRERVFERFYRIGPEVMTGAKVGVSSGKGMGLAIARGIISAHGGRIWIEDARQGQGARVVFSLPGTVSAPAQDLIAS